MNEWPHSTVLQHFESSWSRLHIPKVDRQMDRCNEYLNQLLLLPPNKTQHQPRTKHNRVSIQLPTKSLSWRRQKPFIFDGHDLATQMIISWMVYIKSTAEQRGIEEWTRAINCTIYVGCILNSRLFHFKTSNNRLVLFVVWGTGFHAAMDTTNLMNSTRRLWASSRSSSRPVINLRKWEVGSQINK